MCGTEKKCNSPPLDANPRFHCSIPNFFCTVGRGGSTCTLRVGQGFGCRGKEINFNSEFPSGLCLRPFEPFIKLSHSSHILERNTVRKEQFLPTKMREVSCRGNPQCRKRFPLDINVPLVKVIDTKVVVKVHVQIILE